MYTLLVLLLIATGICWWKRFQLHKKNPAYPINPFNGVDDTLDTATWILSLCSMIGLCLLILFKCP